LSSKSRRRSAEAAVATSEVDEEKPRPPESLDDVIGAIGGKVRMLRKRKGYSLQQLGDRASVSAAAIHKIERNGMVPTITTLMKIASALNRPVGYFIDENNEVDEPGVRTTPEDRTPIFTSIPGLELKSISGPYGRFFLAGAIAVVSPKAESGEQPMTHPGEELVYLLKGTLTFDLDGRVITIRPGDSVHFRGDHEHRWWNPSSDPAEAVWLALRPI
jgi:transcriptional regulator with XRE-family HTH domain